MLAKIPSILVCMDFQGIINEVHHNLVEIKMDFRVFAWLPFKTIQCTFILIVITNFPNYKMTTLPVTRDLAFIWGRDLRGSGTRDDGPEKPHSKPGQLLPDHVCGCHWWKDGDCRDAEPLDATHLSLPKARLIDR